MNSTVAKFLRRTIYFLLLLGAVLVILGSIILSQLDLDNYRYELEQELSSVFELPVSIGYSNLTFHKGLALRFRDLRIGPQDELLADIPYLTATLKIAPLFNQEIFFDRIELDEPKLQFWLPGHNRAPKSAASQLTSTFGVRILTIRDASLKLHQRQQETSRELLNLQHLQLELRDWLPNRVGTLQLAAELRQVGQPAEIRLEAKLPSAIAPEIWRDEELFCRVQLANLTTGTNRSPKHILPNRINLEATLSGTPAQTAHIEAKLTDGKGRNSLFALNGSWTSSQSQERVEQLSGQLLGVPLTGAFRLDRTEQQQHLSGQIGAANLPLNEQLLRRWQVPHADKLLAGQLEQLVLNIEKSWSPEQPFKGLPRIAAAFTLADLEWAGNDLGRIQDFSAELALEDQRLEIRDGLLVVGRQPAFFSGRIESLFKNPNLDIQLELQARLQEIGAHLGLPTGWKIAGHIPTTLRLSGSLQQPEFSLSADLSSTELALGQLLQKRQDPTSRLLIEGQIEAQRVRVKQLEMRLAELVLSGNGQVASAPEAGFFDFAFDPIDLATLQPISPVLQKLQLQGRLRPTLQRSADGLRADLQLFEVATHLNHIVGDLNRANGQLEIDRHGLRFTNLQAHFGQSPFTLNGQLADWQQPQLVLDLNSDQVRAQDLIFYNQQLMLYDLAGQLRIDRHGIEFSRVEVRLEEDTEVVVTGLLDSFENPQVKLDIAGERANIDDVIGLFIGPHKKPAAPSSHPTHPTHPGRPLLISARVNQGTIGDLQFSNAEGMITDHDGVFTIYPLRFSSGEGFCLARIELDRNHPASLLKISGHAEGVDATVLHQDLFKERGLINGPLRGDFYLQGPLGAESFWQNAVGGIHLQVEKGALRKFRGLARVFSLLNVSQLFVGKLPDMDAEGMPFTLLEGTVRIADGRAFTDDMKVHSEAMNMSLIGSQSLIDGTLDYHLGVMPLRTVDKVITSIPIAGWVLAGENKALLTAHFKIEGPNDAPEVSAIPASTLSETVFGIVKRTLGLPGKLVKDIGSLFKAEPKKKEETE